MENGVNWFEETLRYIQEDKAEHYRLLFSIAPLSRTPMDKKSGTALSDYSKKLEKLINDLVPGAKPQRRESLRGKVKPGEVIVILDGGDSNKNPLYEGAKTIRSRNG